MSTTRPSPFARVARWCATHRWQTLLAWVAGIAVAFTLGGVVGLEEGSDFRLPGTESQHAYDVLAEHSPQQNGGADQLVFAVRTGTLEDAAVRDRIERALARVAADEAVVAAVTSPFDEGGQLTPDGRIGVATVTYAGDFDDFDVEDYERVQQAAFGARSSSLQVEHGGQGAEFVRFGAEGGGSEAIGLLVALVVLLITFGSVVAAGVPLLVAIFAVAGTMGLVPVISHLVDTPDFAEQLALLIGLGVGIDYALIVLTRYRTEVAGGLERQEAIVKALDTAGRTVFFAGCTVIIALLGLLLLGLSFLHGPALASALVVALAMGSALTLLPMLLSRAGGWIDRLTLGRKRKDVPADGGRWGRWSDTVERRPVLAIVLSLAVLGGLAVPALNMRLGTADAGLDPAGTTPRKAYDLIADGFGAGINGSFLLVAELPRSGDQAAADAVLAAVADDPGVARALPARLSDDGAIATVTLFPTSGPREEATTQLLGRLRDERLPAVERATGAQVSVGGQVASQEDFTAKIAAKLPLFVAVVVLLSALLLLVVFRSVVIPLKAAAMNLLSIAASLGFLTLVFQEGLGADLLQAGEGPIESFLPVMLFAIVFGLSMDYEVFLVSRIHEEYAKTGDASGAVRTGLASTGRVITAAAAIMVVVFSGFALGDDRIIKEFGIGLAIAILLDAAIIRCLLVPALMHLLGDRAWWVPRGLDRRLPHIAIEAPSATRSGTAASAARPS